jgi:predicted transcriptional regulator
MSTILSVSIPEALRVELDAEASHQRRSRSFIVAEAVRTYLAEQQRHAFVIASERTLREGLALAPGERVRLAEELWQELAGDRTPGPPWIAGFDSFADYDAWRQDGGRPQA